MDGNGIGCAVIAIAGSFAVVILALLAALVFVIHP
jgi:hypothetical protein